MLNIDEIIRIFGKEDRDVDEVILELALAHPKTLTAKEVSAMFAKTYGIMMNLQDDIQPKAVYFGLYRSALGNGNDPLKNLHSTFIFRNLFRLLFETHELDSIKPELLRLLNISKATLKETLKSPAYYRDIRTRDYFEVIAEAVYRLSNELNYP